MEKAVGVREGNGVIWRQKSVKAPSPAAVITGSASDDGTGAIEKAGTTSRITAE